MGGIKTSPYYLLVLMETVSTQTKFPEQRVGNTSGNVILGNFGGRERLLAGDWSRI